MPTVNAVVEAIIDTPSSTAATCNDSLNIEDVTALTIVTSDNDPVLTDDGYTTTALTWPSWNRQYIHTWTDTTGGGGGGTSTSITRGASNYHHNKTWTTWIKQHSTWVLTTATSTITSATTNTVTDPWIVWNVKVMKSGSYRMPAQFPQVQISDEEFQARQRRQEEERLQREARYAAERAERSRATERAQILLQEHLTDQQKAELAEKRFFTVGVIDGKTGERRDYRIHQGRAGNVEQVDSNGQRLKRFCIHPTISCPDEDTMLAQKLWLEHREAEFLRIANHS